MTVKFKDVTMAISEAEFLAGRDQCRYSIVKDGSGMVVVKTAIANAKKMEIIETIIP